MINEQPFKGFPPSDKTEMLTDYLNGIDPNYLNDDEVNPGANFITFGIIHITGHVVTNIVFQVDVHAYFRDRLEKVKRFFYIIN